MSEYDDNEIDLDEVRTTAVTDYVNQQQAEATKVGRIDPGWAQRNPKEAQAQLTRNQWEYAKEVYHPAENAAMAEVAASVDPAADRAGTFVNNAFTRGRQTAERNRSRYGVSVSARNQNIMDRRSKLAESTAVAGAENRTRRALTDRNTDAMATMVGHSQGVANTAGNALDAAAGMQNQRDIASDQMKTQKKQGQMTGAAAGAAMGYQMSGGNPYGAAAGAVVGFFMG